MRVHRRHAFSSALIAVVTTSGLAFGAACSSDESSTPAPEGETSAQRSPEGASERADLVSFKLDDRSQAGITDIWLVWTIKNSSSKKSNYSWDWEAIDASGTRVANGTQLETDVQPGQRANGEFPTTLKSTEGVKLNVTSFDRTAAS
ncbi:hypothetical protein [Streptomyces hydrogenans]|uniref:hypothetical protein n=1 Tax=Streptomyces hydrogenans TaxID=1873719 RepID=UPI0035D7DD3D